MLSKPPFIVLFRKMSLGSSSWSRSSLSYTMSLILSSMLGPEQKIQVLSQNNLLSISLLAWTNSWRILDLKSKSVVSHCGYRLLHNLSVGCPSAEPQGFSDFWISLGSNFGSSHISENSINVLSI